MVHHADNMQIPDEHALLLQETLSEMNLQLLKKLFELELEH